MFALWIVYLSLTIGVGLTGNRFLSRDKKAITAAALFCVGAVIAQVLRNPRLTYPFDHWGMYASLNPPRVYYRFVIATQDGVERDYPFTNFLFAAPGPLTGYSTLTPFTSRLVAMRSRCRCDAGDPPLDGVLAALASRHRESHNEVVSALLIYEMSILDERSPFPIRKPIYRWSTPAIPR